MRGRIGSENEAVSGGLVLQRVEHRARLDASDFPRRVDAQHAIEVFRHVHDDGDVAALTGEARTAAAGQNRRTMLSADLHGRHHIIDVARNDDADRHLPVVGSVGRVECPAATVEAHFATNYPAEIAGKIRWRSCPRDDYLFHRVRSGDLFNATATGSWRVP